MPVDASQIFSYAGALRQVGGRLRREVTKAVGDSGKVLEAAASAAAPKLTGELAGSIEVTGSGLQARVSAISDHAVYQEYGTAKMAAQPFMGPATDVVEGQFYSAIEEAAGRALDI